jgi:hypothetical protein
MRAAPAFGTTRCAPNVTTAKSWGRSFSIRDGAAFICSDSSVLELRRQRQICAHMQQQHLRASAIDICDSASQLRINSSEPGLLLRSGRASAFASAAAALQQQRLRFLSCSASVTAFNSAGSCSNSVTSDTRMLGCSSFSNISLQFSATGSFGSRKRPSSCGLHPSCGRYSSIRSQPLL